MQQQKFPIILIEIARPDELSNAVDAERRLMDVVPQAVEQARQVVRSTIDWRSIASDAIEIIEHEGSARPEGVDAEGMAMAMSAMFVRGMLTGQMLERRRGAERS